jgi:hypothetical protein
VVANVNSRQFTFSSVEQQKQRVALLRKRGYQTVFERGGYIVLHSPAAGPAGAASAESGR